MNTSQKSTPLKAILDALGTFGSLSFILIVAIFAEAMITGYVICWISLPRETAIVTLTTIFIWSIISLQVKNRRLRRLYAEKRMSMQTAMWGGVRCEYIRVGSRRRKHGYGIRYYPLPKK